MGTLVPETCQHIGKDSEKEAEVIKGLGSLLMREIKRAKCVYIG